MNPEKEPDGERFAPHHFYIGVIVSTFAFVFMWSGDLYPQTAAIMTIFGLLIAADDVVSHAFQVPTPLDTVWKRVIYPLIKRIER